MAREITEYGEEDVDEEVCAAACDEEDADGGDCVGWVSGRDGWGSEGWEGGKVPKIVRMIRRRGLIILAGGC